MVLLLDHLKQEELQVIGLGHAPQDGVIRGLLAHLDLPQLPVGILCGGVQHLDEQLLGGKVRAAGRGQIAAPGQQFHGAVVDLLIAAHGVLHRAAGLGKGRRIKDDKVVGVALLFQPGQQFKGVLAEKIHVGQVVALGVALGHGNGLGADVSGSDPGSPALGGVQRKAAGVGKAVQHSVTGSNAGHSPAVVFLVEEKAGFLAVLKINVVEHAVLADLSLGAVGVRLAGQVKPALVLCQALLGPQGLVVALVDALNGLAVSAQDLHQQGEEDGLELFHANAQGLGDKDIVEPVHSQARELVSLAKDDTAGGQVGGLQHSLAVGPGVFDTALPESGIKGVVGVAGDEPHPDLAFQ